MTTDTGTSTPAPRRALPVRPLTLTLLLILLITAGSALTTPWHMSGGPGQTPLPRPTAVQTVTPTPSPPRAQETTAIPAAVRIMLLVLTGLLTATIAAYLLWRTAQRLRRTGIPQRRRPHTPRSAGDTGHQGPVTVLPDMRTGVATATARLRGATTSTDAVIAAWLALEEAAAAAGTPRTAAQTPTELTVAVLHTTPASPDAVTRLLHLYHRARFTDTPLTPHDVTQAETALTDLARTLTTTSDSDGDSTP